MKLLQPLEQFFQEPKPQKLITDPTQVDQIYRHWRLRMLYTAGITYVFAYLCKKNIVLAIPGISEELGISFTALGLIGSALYATYGLGKLLNGMLADRLYIRTFITTGFLLSAFINIIIGFYGQSFLALIILWGLNGYAQSMIFPPISKCLTNWFGRQEMATKWSYFAPANEVGTMLTFCLGGYILFYLNWHYLFIITGGLSIFIGIFLWNRYRGIPQNMGLPPVHIYKHEQPFQNDASEKLQMLSLWQTFYGYILKSKILWLLGIINILIYMIRFGTLDWIFLFLTQHNYTSSESALIGSYLPLAGIIGAFLGGILADKYFKSRKMPINTFCFMLVALALTLLLLSPERNPLLDSLAIFTIGFFIAMTKNLITGVCIVDAGPNNVVAGSCGFVSMLGYIGATASASIIGALLDHLGWYGVFSFLLLCAFIASIMTFSLIYHENKQLSILDQPASFN